MNLLENKLTKVRQLKVVKQIKDKTAKQKSNHECFQIRIIICSKICIWGVLCFGTKRKRTMLAALTWIRTKKEEKILTPKTWSASIATETLIHNVKPWLLVKFETAVWKRGRAVLPSSKW